MKIIPVSGRLLKTYRSASITFLCYPYLVAFSCVISVAGLIVRFILFSMKTNPLQDKDAKLWIRLYANDVIITYPTTGLSKSFHFGSFLVSFCKEVQITKTKHMFLLNQISNKRRKK